MVMVEGVHFRITGHIALALLGHQHVFAVVLQGVVGAGHMALGESVEFGLHFKGGFLSGGGAGLSGLNLLAADQGGRKNQSEQCGFLD